VARNDISVKIVLIGVAITLVIPSEPLRGERGIPEAMQGHAVFGRNVPV